MIEIPILQSVAQEFVILLGEIKYDFILLYNERNQLWTLDIIIDASKVVLLQGLPLVLNQDLLEPYNFNMGHLFIMDNRNLGVDPNYEAFDNKCSLVWLTDAEYNAA